MMMENQRNYREKWDRETELDKDQLIDFLSKSNNELEEIIEAVNDGIVVTDKNGIVTRINKGFETLSGIPRETMLNKDVRIGVEIGAYSASATARVLATKKPVTFTNHYYYKDRTRVGIVTGRPVFDDNGEIIRVVCNIRDITEINKLRDELIEYQLQTARYSKIIARITHSQNQSDSFISVSDKIRAVIKTAVKYAKVDAPILIIGESGTGKEMLTDLIHDNSTRRDTPFLKINCGALPEQLVEAELFGYEEGAFTGAKKGGHMGLFEMAHNGTLLLDEIGEMSMPLQAKLLRFMEKMEFYRVGGNKLIKVDVRLIAATNRDLSDMITTRQFRLDLFHRLNVFNLTVPSLRERRDDILPLIRFFLETYNSKYKTNKKFSTELLNLLVSYDWPGNVRELKNLVERLVVISEEECIFPRNLPDNLWATLSSDTPAEADNGGCGGGEAIPGNIAMPFGDQADILSAFSSFREARDYFEKYYLSKALEKYGSIRKTALHIGISHPAVIKKMGNYGIHLPVKQKNK